MNLKFTLLNLLFIFALSASAQTVTGIWRGYFVQSNLGIYEDRYKFEIQIDQSKTSSIKGVTYSYKTTVFYGKASLQGLYTKKTKTLTITENKLMEVKITDSSQVCLMTCYLEYDKMGSLETLTGTYISRRMTDGGDCGSGKVYLERTTTTDFYKEDFLTKLDKKEKPKATTIAKPKTDAATKPSALNKPATQPKKSTITKSLPKANTTNTPPKVKPGAEENRIAKEKTTAPPKIIIPEVKKDTVVTKPLPRAALPKPDVVKNRSNELVKTIFISSPDIKIELYDNGEIDGDTITVFHNNQMIVSKKRLTDKPITLNIKANEGSYLHEFVMVAENLGSIPPNTALMVVTAGEKRYELFLTSTQKKNAVVVMEYKPGLQL